MSHVRFVDRLSTRRVPLGLGLGAVGVLVWMLIPAATERGNVVLVGDTSSSPLFPEMITHIRDNGRQAAPAVVTPSPCDIADELAVADMPDGVDFAVIVIGPDDCSDDPIDAALAVARDRGLEPVVVRLPETERRDLDAIVVDTEVLLGEPGVMSRPCEWWDPVGPFFSGERSPCGEDGLVVVRAPDGSLTDDGVQRVARMTSAAIG